jgi:uncharacterized protein (TIGR00730 family)
MIFGSSLRMTHNAVMRRVCVFCGSSGGGERAYADAVGELARTLVSRGIGIVYGGGRVGLMGALADTALAAGGEVVGVIPRALVEREVAHQSLTDLHVVGSMHERKALMADLSDAFVTAPGGLGTLEELFEVLTWSQLGLHDKPCALLDVLGYYDHIAGFLDHAVAEGFLRPDSRAMLLVGDEPAELLDRLEAWRPPDRRHWIGPRDR